MLAQYNHLSRRAFNVSTLGRLLFVTAVAIQSWGCTKDVEPGQCEAKEGAEQQYLVQGEVVVDGYSGDSLRPLGKIVDFMIGPQGSIYVADAFDDQVVVYDSQGRWLRSIGGAGNGPGELAGIQAVRYVNDSRVLIISTSRYTWYDTLGNVLGSAPRRIAENSIPWAGAVNATGSAIFDVWMRSDVQQSAIVEVQEVDTFGIGKILIRTPVMRFAKLTNGRGLTVSAPYATRHMWQYDARREVLWLGNSAHYTVVQLSLSGDTIAVFRRPHKAVLLSRRERNSLFQMLRKYEAAGVKVSQSMIPSVKPAFIGFVVFADGSLWVEPIESGRQAGTMDVFSPSGCFLYSVKTEFTLLGPVRPVKYGGMVYAVTEDSLGVQSIMRYRLVTADN